MNEASFWWEERPELPKETHASTHRRCELFTISPRIQPLRSNSGNHVLQGLRNRTASTAQPVPESLVDSWLDWGFESMGGSSLAMINVMFHESFSCCCKVWVAASTWKPRCTVHFKLNLHGSFLWFQVPVKASFVLCRYECNLIWLETCLAIFLCCGSTYTFN